MEIVSVRDLSVTFTQVQALDEINLTIEQGECIGLLGANGAGKTTLLRTIMGLQRPTSGVVTVFDQAPTSNSVRTRIGSTPQDGGIPKALTVAEVLGYVGHHFPDPRPLDETVESFELEPLLPRRVAQLSGGERRKMAIALAMVGRPDFILLDEPTAGLDVSARQQILANVRREFAHGVTAIVTSHYLEDVEFLADRLVVLVQGRIAADGPLADVLEDTGPTTVSFRTPDPARLEARVGDRWPVTSIGGLVSIKTDDPDDLVRLLVRESLVFTELSVQRSRLSDYFMDLTQRNSTGDGGTTATDSTSDRNPR